MHYNTKMAFAPTTTHTHTHKKNSASCFGALRRKSVLSLMNPTGMIPNRFKRIKTSWKSKGTPPNATPPANKALYKALFGGTVVHNPWIKLYVLGGGDVGNLRHARKDKIDEAGQSWYNATNFQFKESFSYGIILLQINKSAQGSAKLSGGQWGIKNFHYTWWIRLHIHYHRRHWATQWWGAQWNGDCDMVTGGFVKVRRGILIKNTDWLWSECLLINMFFFAAEAPPIWGNLSL